jgi:hypothetical protein
VAGTRPTPDAIREAMLWGGLLGFGLGVVVGAFLVGW